MHRPKIIVILGPTATGKSHLAIRLSKELTKDRIGSEVISADSRQVYKGLDIGTGKITEKEMGGVIHHLIDVSDPKKKFSVTEYQKKALKAITDIIKKSKIPIICGGTGFYIDSITRGTIFPAVPPDNKLRKILEKKSSEELFKILHKLDKNRAKNIKDKNELNNKVRLIRAIEIAKSIGKVPKIKEKILPYQFIKIGLYLPNDILKEKIKKRVKQMFKDGLLDEINNLKKSGVSNKRLKEFGFEYDDPTIDKVISESLKYAKRQMTWFKRDKDIIWFDASKKNIFKEILSIKI